MLLGTACVGVRDAESLDAPSVTPPAIDTAPTLRAIGFPGGLENFSQPPRQGVSMARADLATMMQGVLREAENNRESLAPKADDMLGVLAGTRPTDAAVDAALEIGEGMNFSQFKAAVERLDAARAPTRTSSKST